MTTGEDTGHLLRVAEAKERILQVPLHRTQGSPSKSCPGMPRVSGLVWHFGHQPCPMPGTQLGLGSVSWEVTQRWVRVQGVRTEGQQAPKPAFPQGSTQRGQ